MDPVCEEKINFLQKYVPFLANLIELLANDSEKEGKLAQMQLLYNLLNKPDNSVKIETLEKCEEVLSRVFGNAEEKCNDEEIAEATDQNISLVKIIKVEKETLPEASQLEVENKEDTSEQNNGYEESEGNASLLSSCMEVNKANIPPEMPDERKENAEDVHNEKQYEETNEPSDKNDAEYDSLLRDSNVETHGSNDNTSQSSDNAKNENHISTHDNGQLSKPLNNVSDLVGTNACGNNNVQSKLTDENTITQDSEENTSNTDITEDNLLEELIPQNETCETSTMEVRKEDTDIIQNQSEILPFKIISAESLATSLEINLHEETNPTKEDEVPIGSSGGEKNNLLSLPIPADNLIETPIENSIPEKEKGTSAGHQDDTKYTDDDDDDDVLLIETRSSPICIDSDPDEEESITQKCPIPSLQKKIITESHKPPQKPKTSARKSTAMGKDSARYAGNNQAILNKKTARYTKTTDISEAGCIVQKDPKLLMETISLIDSDSDDEEQNTKGDKKHNDDDVIIVGSSSQHRKTTASKKTSLGFSSKQSKRLNDKLPPKPPTAQSNFLNAVNLQPTPETSPNPSSNQASSKRSNIPNAIPSNAPYKRKVISSSSTQTSCKTEQTPNDSKPLSVSIPQVQDRMLKEWLECFLKNFASPLQVASHACFVLLQRVLKYRFFQRLKVSRLVLNMRAKNCEPGKMDLQMLLDLRNMFIQNDTLTEAGRKFCRFATNDAFGKPVALTTDARTGKVTCRTRIVPEQSPPNDEPKNPENTLSITQNPQVAQNQKSGTSATTSSSISPVPSSSVVAVSNSNNSKRIKKLRKLSDGAVIEGNDDNDYTPYMGELVLEDEIVNERKKSLRTNRTKRKEAGFTYSEDHDDEEFEALARKIEEKKREELRLAEERELEKEREKERKVKKTVAKKTTSKRQINVVAAVDTGVPKEPIRKKLRLADAEILGNADDDLLTPTWIEADGDDDDDEVDSLLDFAETPETPEHIETDDRLCEDEEITTQGNEDFETYPPSLDVGTNKLLKNTSRSHHTQCKRFDFCVHCLKRVPRIVHHYVNEHRSAEVFTSRLRTRNIRRLLTTSNVGFVHLYKGNQQQYAAHCIFCDKEVKFLLPYWFEHFTMHTGEYSFKCSGCNIRKPTRSLLANHLQSGSGCPNKGSAMRLHTFDTKSNQIEAHICTLCNYVQLHRKNVLRHLLTQHEIETVSPNHIIKVVLLQVSGPYRDEETIKNNESQLSLLQSSDDEEACVNGAPMSSIDENSLLMQNDFTDNDDLSFMICGMLDVQTNLPATGDILGNDDKTNSVDKK